MKLEIKLRGKKVKAVRKLIGKKDFTELVEKVVDDQLNHIILTNYQSTKSVDEMVEEINK